MFGLGSTEFVSIMVTVMMIVMIFVLPWLDRTICRKLGVSLNDGVSTNPDADRILRIRKLMLIVMFCVYMLMLGYVAFFSRAASEDYHVHVALYEDLANSIKIDFGILGFIKAVFTDGFSAAMKHVSVNVDNIAQVYLNIVMFVPMGYLLPYIFDWFRRKVKYRPVLACFVGSMLVENIQLITKLGFYDIDDIFSNTIGGLLGQLMYIAVAYILTHPDWRKELDRNRRWKKRAKEKTLYPYLGKMGIVRTTLYGTDDKAVYDFYADKLGFRVLRKKVEKNSKTVRYLFGVGKSQVEVICFNEPKELPEQALTFSFNNLNKMKGRLKEEGIDDGVYEKDLYSELRLLTFKGPDTVNITILEGE